MSFHVGCRVLEVNDGAQGATITTRVFYPTLGEETETTFGPFKMRLALGAASAGGIFPLVIVSHGTGGTPFTHRNLAAHLARSGFVVALVQHPGNHRGDDSLSGKAINLQNRPRHVRLVIDAVLADGEFSKHVSPSCVAVIGHSLGAYTALAVAGGNPVCAAWESDDGKVSPIVATHDPRVGALVLLAPAAAWFMLEGALANVHQPILMFMAEKDVHADPLVHGPVIERGIPDAKKLIRKDIANAGHFAFLSPYPPELTSPAIPPSQDPDGFDRAAFQPIFLDEIVNFLRHVDGANVHET